MEENRIAHKVPYCCANPNSCTEVLSEARKSSTKWGRGRCCDGRTRGNSCCALGDSISRTVKQETKTTIRNKTESNPVCCFFSPATREETSHDERGWHTFAACCLACTIAPYFATAFRVGRYSPMRSRHHNCTRNNLWKCSRRVTVRIFFFSFSTVARLISTFCFLKQISISHTRSDRAVRQSSQRSCSSSWRQSDYTTIRIWRCSFGRRSFPHWCR